MPPYKNIVIVDEFDQVIGAMPLLEAKAKQMICRSCRVLVFSESGKLLIQRRGPEVIRPCLFDFSVAGHVDEYETYEQAALRELQEELGIQNIPLFTIATSVPSTNFFSGIFVVTIPDDQMLRPSDEEIDSVVWYSVEEFESELQEIPEKFTPELIDTWSKFRDKILP